MSNLPAASNNLPATPQPDMSFQDMLALCEVVAQSNLVPTTFRGKPYEMLACWLTGVDYGWGLMRSLRSIHVIEGNASLSPEAMLGLIVGQGHQVRVDYELDENGKAVAAVATGKRIDNGMETSESFSLEDAKRAKLSERATWKAYPRNMMRWRAVSNLASALFADVIMGCSYIPEELGARVDQQGEPLAQVKVDRLPRPQIRAPKKPPNLITRATLETPAPKEMTETEAKTRIAEAIKYRLPGLLDKESTNYETIIQAMRDIWAEHLSMNVLLTEDSQIEQLAFAAVARYEELLEASDTLQDQPQ